MGFRIHIFLAVLVCVGCPCIHGRIMWRACGAPSLEERFQTEAPQAWDRYRERAKRLQGSVKITYLYLTPVRKTDEQRLELKQRGDCALLEMPGTNRPDTSRTEELYVINPHYAFHLTRQGAAEGWAIAGLVPSPRGKTPFGIFPNKTVEALTTYPYNFALSAGIGRAIPRDPEFLLKRASSENRDGRALVRVEFEYAAPKDQPKVPSVVGWALYDPKRYWSLVATEAHNSWTAIAGLTTTNAVAYEYQNSQDGFPNTKRIVVHGRKISTEGTFDFEHTYELDLREADAPERDFTLSAFGLPEPKGMAIPRSSRWYLWFIAGGVGCLLVGFLIWRRRQPKISSRPALGGPAMRS